MPCPVRSNPADRVKWAHIDAHSSVSAAHYALTKEEASDIMGHPSFADFLYFQVQAAKQLKYSYYTESRLFFGEIVFSRHRPSPAVQGTSIVISSHYVVTMFGKPVFSMHWQHTWA